MSNRYEGVYAEQVRPQWLFPHAAEREDLELIGDVPEGSQGILLGDPGATALFVVGTVEELKAMAAQLTRLLEQEPPERPVLEEEPPLEVGDRVRAWLHTNWVGVLVEPDDGDRERLAGLDLDGEALCVEWPGGGRQWIERDELERAS